MIPWPKQPPVIPVAAPRAMTGILLRSRRLLGCGYYVLCGFRQDYAYGLDFIDGSIHAIGFFLEMESKRTSP